MTENDQDNLPEADPASGIIPLTETTDDRVVIEGAAGPVVEYKSDDESGNWNDPEKSDDEDESDSEDDGEFPADEDEDNAPVYVEGSDTSTTGSEA
jgi:hypothetical protein